MSDDNISVSSASYGSMNFSTDDNNEIQPFMGLNIGSINNRTIIQPYDDISLWKKCKDKVTLYLIPIWYIGSIPLFFGSIYLISVLVGLILRNNETICSKDDPKFSGNCVLYGFNLVLPVLGIIGLIYGFYVLYKRQKKEILEAYPIHTAKELTFMDIMKRDDVQILFLPFLITYIYFTSIIFGYIFHKTIVCKWNGILFVSECFGNAVVVSLGLGVILLIVGMIVRKIKSCRNE